MSALVDFVGYGGNLLGPARGNALFCFVRCGLGLGNGGSQRIYLPLQFHNPLLHAKIFELGKVVALHKGIGRVALLYRKFKTAIQLQLAGGEFFHIVQTLHILRLQHVNFGIELVAAAVPSIFLILNDLVYPAKHGRFYPAANDFFCPSINIFRENRPLALYFRFQPYHGQAVFHGLVDGIAIGTFGHFVIKLGQHSALFHNLPFVHQHGTQNAAFKILDGLGALRAYHRALGMGYFVHIGNGGPDDQA